jgi:hypothetical protein
MDLAEGHKSNPFFLNWQAFSISPFLLPLSDDHQRLTLDRPPRKVPLFSFPDGSMPYYSLPEI